MHPPAKTPRKFRSKLANIPEHVMRDARLRASLKPIVSKGPFSLVWVNPRQPVSVPEGEDDIGEPVED